MKKRTHLDLPLSPPLSLKQHPLYSTSLYTPPLACMVMVITLCAVCVCVCVCVCG